MAGGGGGTVLRVEGAEVFVVDGHTDGPYFVVVVGDRATCTCKAAPGKWHIRDVMSMRADPLERLKALARERALQDDGEAALVRSARERGASWHRIAVALGRTSEGVRKRYGAALSENALRHQQAGGLWGEQEGRGL